MEAEGLFFALFRSYCFFRIGHLFFKPSPHCLSLFFLSVSFFFLFVSSFLCVHEKLNAKDIVHSVLLSNSCSFFLLFLFLLSMNNCQKRGFI